LKSPKEICPGEDQGVFPYAIKLQLTPEELAKYKKGQRDPSLAYIFYM